MKMKRMVLVVVLSAPLFGTREAVAQEDRRSRAMRGEETTAPSSERGIVWSQRSELERQVLARWAGSAPERSPGSDPEELATAVRTVSETRLAHAATARNFDTFIRRLGGGAVGIQSGGTIIPDSVFVPTTPCRILDTRSAVAGKMNANETRSFYSNEISAGATNWANQGGDPSNCPEIPFDPPAVLITVTAASPEANGNARIWAFLGTEPLASNLNFTTNVNIANTTSTPTCFSCGPDINIKVTQRVHMVADIVGYFRAKDKTMDLQVMSSATSASVSTGVNMGLSFADGAFDVFRITQFLPDDYSPNTDLTARFYFSIAQTGCDVNWVTNNPLRVLRPGSGSATVLTATPDDQAITVPGVSGNIFQNSVTLSSTPAVGDVLTLSWFRSTSGDTCTAALILRGVQLIYD